jgi:hypothetical protein
MSNTKAEDFQQILSEITRRSTIDPEFRALALQDARAAYQKVSNKELPKDISIRFIDNSGSTKTVPLPDPVTGIDEKDIEAELENVAGGTWSAGNAFSSGPKPKPALE